MKESLIVLLILGGMGFLAFYITFIVPFKVAKGAVKVTKKAVSTVANKSSDLVDSKKRQAYSKSISENNTSTNNSEPLDISGGNSSMKRSSKFDN